jgi:hypothetical protein
MKPYSTEAKHLNSGAPLALQQFVKRMAATQAVILVVAGLLSWLLRYPYGRLLGVTGMVFLSLGGYMVIVSISVAGIQSPSSKPLATRSVHTPSEHGRERLERLVQDFGCHCMLVLIGLLLFIEGVVILAITG